MASARATSAEQTLTTPSVALIGAGFAGICMGIQLKKAGFHSFTIYEKADRVGGVWRDNSYPGASCDVPSMVYSFSFEPRHDWSHVYSEQAEIQRYLEWCVDKYGLRPHIRFRTEMAGARFDATAGVWRLKTTTGEENEANVVVTGTGQLNRPRIPEIPGLSDFAGTSFHSARWDHNHKLAGRRVAVIGNGASAIQFIPRIARIAREVVIFQRSANWLTVPLPKNRAYRPWEQRAFRHVPLYARLHRGLIYAFYESRLPGFTKNSLLGKAFEGLSRAQLRWQVPDRRLREALTPNYPMGCKRVLLSADYYPALMRPNVRVVTEPIARVASDGIVTRDGTRHSVDTIILATGFDSQGFLAPMEIEGLDGRRLSEAWRAGAEAYLGLAVSGFPNLFLLYGPNTGLAHHSIIIMIESQVRYVMQCIARLRRERLKFLGVRPEVQASYNEWLQRRMRTRVWDAGCTSWYKTATGKVTSLWVGSTIAYRRRTRRHDPADFYSREIETALEDRVH